MPAMIELRSALMLAITPANSRVRRLSRSAPAAFAKSAIFALASAISVRRDAMAAESAASASSLRQLSSPASSGGPLHTCAGEISETLRWMQGQSGSSPAAAAGPTRPEYKAAASTNPTIRRITFLIRRTSSTRRAAGTAAPRDDAARRVVAVDGRRQEHHEIGQHEAERLPVQLTVECKANQLDRMAEGIPGADVIEGQTRFLHPPQRIESGRGEEHREDHEIHDPGEVLELLDQRGQQEADGA